MAARQRCDNVHFSPMKSRAAYVIIIRRSPVRFRPPLPATGLCGLPRKIPVGRLSWRLGHPCDPRCLHDTVLPSRNARIRIAGSSPSDKREEPRLLPLIARYLAGRARGVERADEDEEEPTLLPASNRAEKDSLPNYAVARLRPATRPQTRSTMTAPTMAPISPAPSPA